MTDFKIKINPDYVAPEGPLENDADYVNLVMNGAARSYQSQYGTADLASGITAAREAYNAALPPPEQKEETTNGDEARAD